MLFSPLRFQNRIRTGDFITRCSVRAVHKGYEFYEQTLAAHTEPFAQALAEDVVTGENISCVADVKGEQDGPFRFNDHDDAFGKRGGYEDRINDGK